jgi:hypothetical protein
MDVVSLNDTTDDYREYEGTAPRTRREIHIFETWLNFIDAKYRYTGPNPPETHLETFRYVWGDFITLSYEWGDSPPTEDIVLNGHTVQIREN